MAITFNESYYLQTNPDVALAVSLRQFASGADHFNKLGANELRNPNAVFDSKYYAAQNPDVLTAVSAKTFSSVYAHYLANGLKEGRAPNASLKGFDGADYIAKNPDVATAGFTAATALQHYVQYGVDENRSFTSSTAGAVVGNVSGTTGDDTITPAGGQSNTVRVEGGQQGAAGDTLVITSGSASSFQVIDLSNNGGDQNQTRDNTTGPNTGAKVGPVLQGFENVDARQATINMNITAIDRTSVGNTGSVASTITGSVIQGGTGRDTLTGNAGADSLVGGVGNDTINGFAGNDSILGGADDDVISGGAGNDTISDEAGNDTVTGDAGADIITVGAGINSIDGGADNDTINVTVDQATSTTVSTIAGGAGDDTINLGASVGTAASAITAASRTSVSGGTGNDTILASLGVETVNGGANNDTVRITATNLGATDVFNGNDGQDIIQLEIPTGSGTNTFVFTPVGTTAATSQFNGFEAIALIDSSGNTNAKSYKLILTDTFLAQNLVNGSFLIDARGLPGGSNLVIDFSQLTAASAAAFTATNFRVLTSPSTDVRDQNNVGIINSYTVNTGNALLNATAAFTVFAGETTITAGTAGAYNTDRTVNTGTGQAAYTTVGGAVETAGTGGVAGTAFTLTIGNDTFAATTTGTNDTFTGSVATLGGNDIIVGNGGTDVINLSSQVGTVGSATANVVDIDTINLATAADVTLNGTLFSAVGEVVLTGAGAANLAALSADAGTNTTFTLGSGYAKVITDATNLAAKYSAAGSVTGSGISTGKVGVTLNTTAASTVSTVTTGAGALTLTGSGALTLGTVTTATSIAGSAMTGVLTYTESGIAVTSGTANDVITLGAATTANVTTGAGNDTVTAVAGTGLTTADTVNLGTGTDTLALTGNVAVAATDLNLVSGLEVLTVANTTTNIAITTVEALVDVGATLTLAATSLTTGTLTFNGAAENNGFFNITGGAANDTFTGGLNADTINGGAGNDTINKSNGADRITLGDGNDVVVLTTAENVFGTGVALITDFVSGATTSNDSITLNLTSAASITNVADVANLTNTTNLMILTTAQTTAQITAASGVAAANAVIAVFNSTTGRAELWTDDNWTSTAGRVQIATLDNITTLVGVTGLSTTDGTDFTIT